MINLVEESTISKTGNESDNEDGLFCSDKYIAVIDGATSKVQNKSMGKSGGQIIRDIIILELSCMSGTEKAEEAINKIQKRIINEFPAEKNFPVSASAAIYSVCHNQIWLVGDCQAIVDNEYYCEKKRVDEILSEARSMAIFALIEEGMSENDFMQDDKGRELIMPFLKLQRYLENKRGHFGYITFNNSTYNESILSEKVKIINASSASEIVLASDGYPILKSTLEETEKELAKVIHEDPLCYKINRSTKGIINGNCSYDDRTYIKFSIS